MEPEFTSTSFEKWMITVTVMLVAVVEVLDMTIVNVSLPNMMGSFSATSKEITWILTAYIVSAAICMPLTGTLLRQFGQRRLLLLNIVGFLIASMLCGAATSLSAMIGFRILQGIFGASLVPISQYILRTTFSRAEQGAAMAIWGMAIMTAPILGPTVGGHITEALNWRWIFYINIPVCLLAFVMTLKFIRVSPYGHEKIDWRGLFLMVIAVGSFQVFIDRGNSENWFDSNFITGLAALSAISFVTFIYRGWNKKHHIINLRLFTERHFSMTFVIFAIYSVGIFGTLVLLPIMLETALNYPPDIAGDVMAPRGIAAALAMVMVSRLNKYVDNRILVFVGIIITAWGTYQMTFFNMSGDMMTYIMPGLIQGVGVGMVIVPLSSCAFDYLEKSQVAEATGLFSFGRSMGVSIGISILTTIHVHQTRVNWQRLGAHIQATNPNFTHWASNHGLSVNPLLSLQLAAQQVQQQSTMIAFIDAFWAATLLLLMILPLVFFLKKGRDKN